MGSGAWRGLGPCGWMWGAGGMGAGMCALGGGAGGRRALLAARCIIRIVTLLPPTYPPTYTHALPVQSMARKLRIFEGERHDYEGHPALMPFQMPPRKLREKGQLFELPEGFEPFNPQVGAGLTWWPRDGKLLRFGIGIEECIPKPHLQGVCRTRHPAPAPPTHPLLAHPRPNPTHRCTTRSMGTAWARAGSSSRQRRRAVQRSSSLRTARRLGCWGTLASSPGLPPRVT